MRYTYTTRNLYTITPCNGSTHTTYVYLVWSAHPHHLRQNKLERKRNIVKVGTRTPKKKPKVTYEIRLLFTRRRNEVLYFIIVTLLTTRH